MTEHNNSSERESDFDAGDEMIDHAKVKNPNLDFACTRLRTKTMFYDFNRENALSIGQYCDTQTYWCVMTGAQTGPDGDIASRTECGPHRSCCVS